MALYGASILAGILLPRAAFADRWVSDFTPDGLYNTIGCYLSPSTLGNKMGISGAPWVSNNMTLTNCEAYCYSSANGGPFNYFGVQNGNSCYCGNTLHVDERQYDDDSCAIPCPGPNTQGFSCGGTQSMDIYSLVAGRTRGIADLPDQKQYNAGCYNWTDVSAYNYDQIYPYHENVYECASDCRWDTDDGNGGWNLTPGFYGFSLGQLPQGRDSSTCACYNAIDWTKVKPIPMSNCMQMPCGHSGRPGDSSQWCGGFNGSILIWSNATKQDFASASKATSLASWSTSMKAASTSKFSAQSSKTSSKSAAASSRSSAASRMSSSQASASSSRSTARSLVNSSKTAASTSRSIARSSVSSSKSVATASRTSARARVSSSQSSASLARSSVRQSMSASRSSARSLATSSASSRSSARTSVSASQLSAFSSRSKARSVFTSSSLSRYSSLVSNTARISSSRTAASTSRASANQANAASWTSASRSLSTYYSSKSYSAYLVSSSKSAAQAGAGHRYGDFTTVTTVTTVITVDTSSSDLPFTSTDSTATDTYQTAMAS